MDVFQLICYNCKLLERNSQPICACMSGEYSREMSQLQQSHGGEVHDKEATLMVLMPHR